MAKLVVLSEGFAGRAHELKVDKTTIGRMEDNAFQLSEPSVSSHHCEVFFRGEEVVVKDLNSTNGTFINGERISEAVLKPGQILRLGQVELRLEDRATVPAAKKALDQTRAIRQGVKLGDLDQANRPVTMPPFAKKSNKPQIIFITVAIVLAVIVIVFMSIAFFKMSL